MRYSVIVGLILIVLIIFGVYWVMNGSKAEGFEEKRTKIISEINDLLKEASLSGDYKCCIEPDCKMCFLGDWHFKDGRCDCDGFVAKGEWDEVCPECKSGIEKGGCQSSLDNGCIIEI